MCDNVLIIFIGNNIRITAGKHKANQLNAAWGDKCRED